ncbi:hypothetical protein JXB11_02640 [Candidatus Woesearchaeota archaeon]|nr:hypothetical protein [Candidatus Woesearchaeota archaeon]
MFVDLVIPERNEKAFIEMGGKLGVGGICFLYKSASDFRRIGKLKSAFPIFAATFRRKGSTVFARLKSKELCFDAESRDFPQGAIPGFSFCFLSDSKNLPARIKSVRRSVKAHRKGNRFLIASLAKNPYSMRSHHDLMSLFVCLGMLPGEAKKAASLAAVLLSAEN